MLRPPRLPSLAGRDSALMAYLRELQAFAQQNQVVSGVGYRLNVRPVGTTIMVECQGGHAKAPAPEETVP